MAFVMNKDRLFFPKNKPIAGTRLTPIAVVKIKVANGAHRWAYRCRCECGNETLVAATDLGRLKVRSCGCYRHEAWIKRITSHGLSNRPEWSAARNAFRRCCNRRDLNYRSYGARGIKCEFHSVVEMARWLLKNMPKPKGKFLLDRIDNFGHYAPGNLRWSTPAQSASNRTTTVLVEIGGEKKSITEWSRVAGISASGFRHRMNLGISGQLLLRQGKLSAAELRRIAYESDNS